MGDTAQLIIDGKTYEIPLVMSAAKGKRGSTSPDCGPKPV